MMNVEKRSFLRISVLLAVVATAMLFIAVGSMFLAPMVSASTPIAPLNAPVAAITPAACTAAGGAQTCDLWAKEGTISLPGLTTTVPIWGFTDSAGGAAQLPGPPIVVTQGETVTVILHNDMTTETVALTFTGQDLAPELNGVAPGGVYTYTFTATNPGTFRYEAGMTISGTNGARQVAMGLYGALIVRPAANANWAYDDAATAFDKEALLVLSEIDLEFQADPYGFDMAHYIPDFWLINGKTFSQTEKIVVAPNDAVLFRYVNAGLQEHTMGLLGLRQTVLATDGRPFPYPKDLVVRMMAGGETADSLVKIPNTLDVVHYPIYNAGLQQLHNNGVGPFGGILTFLEVSGAASPTNGGPLASNVQVAPALTAGDDVVTLTADLASPSGLDIVAWEYYTNSLAGTPTLITLTTPVSATAVLTAIPTTTMQTWSPGDITFYVRAQDANNVWGPVNSAILDLVTQGPAITSLGLNGVPTDGSAPVSIQATADGTHMGAINVAGAEYFIGACGADGSGAPMNYTQSPISSLTASIDATGWTEGVYPVHVHALDALGNWGACAAIDLLVDQTGPTSFGSSVKLTPNPNNGTLSVNSSSPGVLLDINAFNDINTDPLVPGSVIVAAEGFIDYVDAATNPDGSGFPLIANDAMYDESSERAYFVIPLTAIRQMTEGDHTISFHAKDAAGNWGTVVSETLTIDKTGPTASGLTATPTTITRGVGQLLTLEATATDTTVNIATAEWFIDVDPGAGQGLPLGGAFSLPTEALTATVSVDLWSIGAHIVFVRAKDAAGNWGATVTTTVTIQEQVPLAVVFGQNFENANLAHWTGTVGNVGITPAAALGGSTLGMQTNVSGGVPAYVIADLPDDGLTAYEINFDFDPNGTDPAADEQEILAGRNTFGAAIFGVRFEQGPSGPELLVWALNNGVQEMTAGIHINDEAQNVRLIWESGANVDAKLIINGNVEATLSGLDTSMYVLDELWLGPSTVAPGASDTQYFDNFEVWPKTFTYFFPLFLN